MITFPTGHGHYIYGKAVSLAVPVFLFLIFLELAVDRIKGTRYYHLADAVNSMSCGIIGTGMRILRESRTIAARLAS